MVFSKNKKLETIKLVGEKGIGKNNKYSKQLYESQNALNKEI